MKHIICFNIHSNYHTKEKITSPDYVHVKIDGDMITLEGPVQSFSKKMIKAIMKKIKKKIKTDDSVPLAWREVSGNEYLS